jgi:hypothetical protein
MPLRCSVGIRIVFMLTNASHRLLSSAKSAESRFENRLPVGA